MFLFQLFGACRLSLTFYEVGCTASPVSGTETLGVMEEILFSPELWQSSYHQPLQGWRGCEVVVALSLFRAS